MTNENAAAIDGSTVFALARKVEVQSFDQGGVILNAETGQLYSCNHVTLAYLKLLDGERTLDAAAAMIAEEYEVPVDEVSRDLIEVSADLAGESLLTAR